MPEHLPPLTTAAALLESYDTFLFDSYGVLTDSSGALPHARELLAELRRQDKTFLVLSNDASRLPATSLRRLVDFGFDVRADEVLTSGDLIADHVEAQALRGCKAIVLGPEDSRENVRRAGCEVVSWRSTEADAVFVCDDDGYPFLEAITHVIGWLYGKLDRGENVHLCVPNPDLIYPMRGANDLPNIGLTAGSVAVLIEHALAVRFVGRAPRFVPLGKPSVAMFEEAARRLGHPTREKMIMIGDQMPTDIRGAIDFGIHAALVGTGVSTIECGPFDPMPTWRLRDLSY